MLSNQTRCLYAALITFSCVLTATATEIKSRSIYIKGETGWSSMASGFVTPYQFKDKQRFGYHLSTGYLFPINSFISLGPEIGYGHYGKTRYENSIGLISNYQLNGWDVLANFKFSPNEWLNLYFKVGMNDLNQKLVVVGGATPGGFYQQAVKPMLELTGTYPLTQHTELSLSYTRVFANKAPLTSSQQFTFTNVNQISSINAVMVGILYFV